MAETVRSPLAGRDRLRKHVPHLARFNYVRDRAEDALRGRTLRERRRVTQSTDTPSSPAPTDSVAPETAPSARAHSGPQPITDPAKLKAREREDELVARCQQGDRAAFNELVALYQKKIYSLCYRVMNGHSDAEDVAQDVFVTVYNNIGQFRGEASFSTWIYRVTVNHCKNRLKYLNRRHHFRTLSIDTPVETDESTMVREIEDEADSPEDILGDQQILDKLQAGIEQLDEDYRTVIILRDVQGEAYQDIADILGIKEGTVKSRIHRARMELKKILGPVFEEALPDWTMDESEDEGDSAGEG